jgi:lysophospholipase L1-like esterase
MSTDYRDRDFSFQWRGAFSKKWFCFILFFGLSIFLFTACSNSGKDNNAQDENNGWIGAWAAAPYGPYPLGPLSNYPVDNSPVDPLAMTTIFPDDQAEDQSFRMIVHPTIGGEKVRIRLSNLMGNQPIIFDSVHVAIRALGPALPAIMPDSEKSVLFNGSSQVIINPGKEAISDPVDFVYSVGDDLAISYHVVGKSGPMTWHAISFGLNYVSLPTTGDTTSDPTGVSFTQISVGWFFISGVDVYAPEALGTIVAFGDSITDGAYEVPETNTRWPDLFAQRLADEGIAMGVLNQGINSNTVTPELDGFAGPCAIYRFERDVLERPGVKSVVILEGTNDLAAGVPAEDVYAGICSLVDQAHAAGLRVVVGTITPRLDVAMGWDPTTGEPERQELNALLRADTSFDGLAEFDKALASPLDPSLPNVPYYFADLLHPNSIGFMIMSDTVPLEALVP